MFSRDVALRIFFLLVGTAPIASLSGAIFEIVPLHISFKFVILPAYGLAVIVGIAYWNVGRLALMGLIAGIIAVTLYDMTRWPWVIMGLWGDFIPSIGGWMFDNPESDWVWGYVWRYIGNGGGMGMADVTRLFQRPNVVSNSCGADGQAGATSNSFGRYGRCRPSVILNYYL